MNTLYIERSVSSGRNGNWVNDLALEPAPARIVVGTGPGSFAGIRAALAFAQGYALGRKCEVLGLPSPCALAADGKRRAVVGDARRGKAWVMLFDGFRVVKDVVQVEQTELAGTVPADFDVVSPDDARLGTLLAGHFGTRYLGGATPKAEGLKAFAEANPDVLRTEPLPIYLNPAVRT